MAQGIIIAESAIANELSDSVPENVVLIDLNLPPNRKARQGLEKALELRKSEETRAKDIIVMSFESPASLYQDKRFQMHMSSSKGHYVRFPKSKEDLFKVLNIPSFDNQALASYASSYFKQDQVRILLHDYKYRPQEVMQEARNLGFEGNDDAIYQALQSYKPKRANQDSYFSGTFVDIEGTILVDGKLNMNLVKELEQHLTGPISFWTGGDINSLANLLYGQLEQLAKNNEAARTLFHRSPILPKDFFAGSEVERSYDDNPKSLASEYSITVRNLIKTDS